MGGATVSDEWVKADGDDNWTLGMSDDEAYPTLSDDETYPTLSENEADCTGDEGDEESDKEEDEKDRTDSEDEEEDEEDCTQSDNEDSESEDSEDEEDCNESEEDSDYTELDDEADSSKAEYGADSSASSAKTVMDLKQRIFMQRASLRRRVKDIKKTRLRLQRYEPGQWLVEAGGMEEADFAIPEVTTLLLVGAMGAGKSTLVNNLIRVLNNKKRDFDRAQVCGDPAENGTYFLNEYMLCENKNTICVFDSRGMPEVKIADGLEVLGEWMEKGVRHGQMVISDSDSSKVVEAVERKGRQGHHKLSKTRRIDFVIFVINAVAVHKLLQSGENRRRPNFLRIFKFPLITFKDDKPVIVMTHGDELSDDDRIATRMYLGNMLGVSPVDHIFDITGFTGRVVEDGEQCAENDLLLLDMLEFALQRADRNLPYKTSVSDSSVGDTVESTINPKIDDMGHGSTLQHILVGLILLVFLVGIILKLNLYLLKLATSDRY